MSDYLTYILSIPPIFESFCQVSRFSALEWYSLSKVSDEIKEIIDYRVDFTFNDLIYYNDRGQSINYQKFLVDTFVELFRKEYDLCYKSRSISRLAAISAFYVRFILNRAGPQNIYIYLFSKFNLKNLFISPIHKTQMTELIKSIRPDFLFDFLVKSGLVFNISSIIPAHLNDAFYRGIYLEDTPKFHSSLFSSGNYAEVMYLQEIIVLLYEEIATCSYSILSSFKTVLSVYLTSFVYLYMFHGEDVPIPDYVYTKIKKMRKISKDFNKAIEKIKNADSNGTYSLNMSLIYFTEPGPENKCLYSNLS